MSDDSPAKLYKYRAGNRQDLDSLRNAYIWAASLSSLNDPFESRVDVGDDAALRWVLDFELQRLRGGGICSFAADPLDARSWAYYADSYQGYCVEYDAAMLLQSVAYSKTLLKVEYAPTPPLIELFASVRLLLADAAQRSNAYAQAIVGTKELGWSHEREWRLVVNLPGRQQHDPAAITSIYVGHRMAHDRRRKLIQQLRNRQVTVHEVRPSNRSYLLEAIRLTSF